ncbi:MAG: hypothetical protein JW818_12175 [Pirellulales bacterium]|nr:hypothetical protein [Pirellulales bacterium]
MSNTTFSAVLRIGQVGLVLLAVSLGCTPSEQKDGGDANDNGNPKPSPSAQAPDQSGAQPGGPSGEPGQIAPQGSLPLPPPDMPKFGGSDAPGPLPTPSAGAPSDPTANWPPESSEPLPLGQRPNPLRKEQDPTGQNPIRPGVDAPPGPGVAPPGPAPSAPVNGDDHASPGAKGGEDEKPFDPIKENGPIFEGWTVPKLAIVITGREDGYMEPCGCAGLDRMKGGMSRRHTMIELMRDKWHWPVLAVDAGGLSKGFGVQTEIKFRITVEAMRKMRYEAVAFGKNDLQLPAGELVSVAASLGPDDPSPFVSANVGLISLADGYTDRSRIVERGGLTIGITSVLGKEYQREIHNGDVELIDPAAAIAQVLPELKKKCNLLILLAHCEKDEAIELARQFPDFRLVVTSGGLPSPPDNPERIENTESLLIEVGEKGMDAVVLGLYNDPKEPLRYQRVPLDSRFPASQDMKRLMVAYQEELKRLGLSGLRIKAVSHPLEETNGPFVGSEACKSCHEESYRVWKKSGHAHAWKTLKETDPPRVHDPQCISCHVVGWHPTEYFPYKSGFLSDQTTPKLIDVGCESCHGPGGAHCAAEEGSDLALQEKLQKAMVVTKEQSQKDHTKWCQNCHDIDNSPDFNFKTYWPQIEHYED